MIRLGKKQRDKLIGLAKTPKYHFMIWLWLVVLQKTCLTLLRNVKSIEMLYHEIKRVTGGVLAKRA